VPRKCTSVYRFGLAFFGRFVGIVQAIIFILQLIVFGIQAWKLDQTVKAAAQQGSDMKRSIDEATRAANAMEISAKAATVASQAAAQSVALLPKQMRAYLSVRIGGGVYQDRAVNLRFEVTPMLINTGLTPANRVSYAAKANVLPFPLADEFVFPPLDKPRSVFGLLAPQQNLIMNAMVKSDFFDDGEVENIKRGRGRRVYIWGTVVYEDVFGEQRYTNFAHSIIWLPSKDGSEPIWGYYVDRHNDAN
jgi:hypothetical protein